MNENYSNSYKEVSWRESFKYSCKFEITDYWLYIEQLLCFKGSIEIFIHCQDNDVILVSWFICCYRMSILTTA